MVIKEQGLGQTPRERKETIVKQRRPLLSFASCLLAAAPAPLYCMYTKRETEAWGTKHSKDVGTMLTLLIACRNSKQAVVARFRRVEALVWLWNRKGEGGTATHTPPTSKGVNLVAFPLPRAVERHASVSSRR